MAHQPMIDCPNCGTYVMPTSQGVCPACRVQLPADLAPAVASSSGENTSHAIESPPTNAVESHKPVKTVAKKRRWLDLSLKNNLRFACALIIGTIIILIVLMMGPSDLFKKRPANDPSAEPRPRTTPAGTVPGVGRGAIKVELPNPDRQRLKTSTVPETTKPDKPATPEDAPR